jgi:hypothetical protein
MDMVSKMLSTKSIFKWLKTLHYIQTCLKTPGFHYSGTTVKGSTQELLIIMYSQQSAISIVNKLKVFISYRCFVKRASLYGS